MSSAIKNEKSISSIINDEYKSYAMYVLGNRALACYVDGFKPVQRKLVYSMLNQYNGKRTKVADLGSISSIGYHHGEVSAQSAAIGLAANHSNNIPVFKQHGAFGSRLIPTPASPRYIFTSLNPGFKNYFSDFDVMESSDEAESPEPKTYLPNIPWILVNGVKGIAIGFACEFLPHSVVDIARATKASLNGKKQKSLVPVFPGFIGEVKELEPGKYQTTGIIDKIKRNTYEISEVPYGINREKYFAILAKLEDDNKIQSFTDNCAGSFNFVIKTNNEQAKKIDEDPISYFKLSKTYTENYNALDENGCLVQFDSKAEIIDNFVTFRLEKIEDQRLFDLEKYETELEWLTVKYKFSSDILADRLDFKTMSRDDLEAFCMSSYRTTEETANRLLRLSIVSITTDLIVELKNQIAETKAKIAELEQSDNKVVFNARLDDIIKNSTKWSKQSATDD